MIMGFDTQEIYGSNIWVLYSDVCHQNIVYLLAVMRAVQLGKKTQAWLRNLIRERKPAECEEILQGIMGHLTEFNRGKSEAA